LRALEQSTFKEFLYENRQTLIDGGQYLLLSSVLTVLVWLFEQATRGSRVWPVPLHWIPELGFFLGAGDTLAELKGTVLPTELIVLITSIGGTLFAAFTFEFSLLGWAIGVLFISPLIGGYCFQRLQTWMKIRRRLGARDSRN